MYQQRSAGVRRNIRVFRYVDEAMRWVKGEEP